MQPALRFIEIAVLIFRAQFRWFNRSGYIANKLILPVLQFLVFSLLGIFATGSRHVQYFMIGNAMALAFLGALGSAYSLSEEGVQDTLGYLIGSPVSRVRNFLQRGLVPVLDGLVSVIVAFAIGTALFGIDLSHTNLPSLAASILAASFSCICLGFVLGAIALAYLDLYFVFNSVYVLMLAIAGVNFPPSYLPAWLHPLSSVVPLTHSIAAARAAASGADLPTVASLLAAELLVGMGYLVIGYVLLGRLEHTSRRRGVASIT